MILQIELDSTILVLYKQLEKISFKNVQTKEVFVFLQLSLLKQSKLLANLNIV